MLLLLKTKVLLHNSSVLKHHFSKFQVPSINKSLLLMNYLRVLCLTTTAAISGCLSRPFVYQWKEKSLNVNAASGACTCPCTCKCPRLTPKQNWPCNIPSSDISPEIMHVPIYPHPIFPKRSILEFDDFIGCFDNTTKTPVWTLELVNRASLKKKGKISPLAEPLPDCRVPKEFSSESGDYDDDETHSKLFVASPKLHATDDYLFLTNVVPHEKDVAGKRSLLAVLNSYVRYLTAFHANVYVCTGSLYLPKLKVDGDWYVDYAHIGENKVAVPSHFFKVIVAENEDGSFRFECYKVRNSPATGDEDIREFIVSREILEKEAGFEIFDQIEPCMIRDTDTHPGFCPPQPCGQFLVTPNCCPAA